MPHDSAELVRAAQSGDRAAFGRLHELYAPVVHGILLASAPAQETEDLVQDVFIHAFSKLRGLRDPEAFGPWLATITRSFTVRFYRRRLRTGHLAPDRPAHHDGGADGAARAEEAGRALAAIRRLPEAYRETLILRLVEGLTGPQIAACTGLTPGSVRVNLHRGLKLLRDALDLPEDGS